MLLGSLWSLEGETFVLLEVSVSKRKSAVTGALEEVIPTLSIL